MGAWNHTAFGNDNASDWASDLIENKNPRKFLEKTLQLASQSDYLEAPEGSALIAAAALIAQAPGLPDALAEWSQGQDFEDLAPRALAGLERAAGEESELRELWEDSDDFEPWLADLDAIRARLA